MLSQFIDVVHVDADDKNDLAVGMYYFGGSDDGSMKTGSVTVKDDNLDSYKFYFGTKDNTKTGENKGVGITGNKSNKLYYMGHLVAAQDYRYQPVVIDDYTFIVNSNGSIQHSKVQYKEDGDVLIDAKKNADKIVYQTAIEQFKYGVKDGTGLVVNVDYLDPTDIMSVDGEYVPPTDSNAQTPSNAQ